MKTKRKIIPCPFCKKEDSDLANGIWPFCSERCKLSDIGEWTAESYTIAGKSSSSGEELLEEE